MANPFGLQEVTLNQLGDSTHAINAVDTTGAVSGSPRKSVYQPISVIVSNHEDTTSNLTTDWPDGTGATADAAAEDHMTAEVVIMTSSRHGEPFVKGGKRDMSLKHILHEAAGIPAVPVDVTVLYPNFDYTTFE